ncbi:MAG TPA: group 1 truncated hemoglobin [Burkholderiaceae bacterium]
MIFPNRTLSLVAVAALLALAGCMSPNTQSMPARPSLYDRLGGKPAITAVVDDFISNVASDPKINARFANANIAHLKQLLVEQICAGAGGPCAYSGRDMETAHRGMNIRDEEFDALVGDLVKSLDKFKVPNQEKGELLALLGPAKPQIVGH